ncbi:hypothetical protein K504DRAFT_509039 [Pleomassaria siparia CBS 279.74]|uniref:Uncharacterized protein n=1 Tax=Pleomassaria siparia CBS 279.74 TaxID=1314801 RepID=A0A6G1JQB2_9PLEO|nr:hypothetical protein K504DRAFT_509039 [Pleomassaria siparia CBS 279.74]
MDWAVVHQYTAPSKDPMLQYLKDTGLNLRHSLLLAKVFTFFLRVYVKNLPRPPTLETTRRQEGAWAAVQQHLVNCNGTYLAVDPTHARSKLNAFKRLCDEFWLSLIEQTSVASDFESALVTALAFIADQGAPLQADERPVPTDNSSTQSGEAAWLIYEQGEAVRQRKGAGEAETKEEYATPVGWVITTAYFIGQVRYGETLDAVVRRHGDTVTIGDVSTMFSEYAAIVWQV